MPGQDPYIERLANRLLTLSSRYDDLEEECRCIKSENVMLQDKILNLETCLRDGHLKLTFATAAWCTRCGMELR